ncbi:MAG TPA: glycosyltransferase family 4 protein [Bryobacteraceae bacterium]
MLFDGVPRSLETAKDAHPSSVRIFGNSIFVNQLLIAFLTYGTADHYYFFIRDPSCDVVRTKEQLGLPTRAELLTPITVMDLPATAATTFVTPRAFPQNLSVLRKLLSPSSAIVSFIHALSDILACDLCVYLLSLGALRGDAVVCSSHAGKIALQRLLLETAISLGVVPHQADAIFSRFMFPVIPLGLHCDRYRCDQLEARLQLGIRKDDIVILSFGRLSPFAKADPVPLLLAFRELLAITDRRLMLLIAGDDTRHQMADKLRDYASSLGCHESVAVYPDVSLSTKRALYGAADIFVSLSDHIQETFGIALMEAMASRLPVVAADWSGHRDIVQQGITGYLIPTYWVDLGDELELLRGPLEMEGRNSYLSAATVVDMETLIDRLKRLINNAALRQEMGASGYRRAVETYDWRRVVPRYEELFNGLKEAIASDTPNRRGLHGGPHSYKTQQIFSSYPTGCLDDNAPLVLTSLGRRWLCAPFPLNVISEHSADLHICRSILSVLHTDPEGSSSVETLGRYFNQVFPRFVIRSTVGRLIKYGLLSKK